MSEINSSEHQQLLDFDTVIESLSTKTIMGIVLYDRLQAIKDTYNRKFTDVKNNEDLATYSEITTNSGY